MPPLTLYGAAYSVYVRAARLVLVEKGVAYDRVSVDIYGAAAPEWHRVLRPFGCILDFARDGFRLYETGAIHTIDEALDNRPSSTANAFGPLRSGNYASYGVKLVPRPELIALSVEQRRTLALFQ